MNYEEILKAIKNPERTVIELKQNFNQWTEIAETIAAFSTERGGKIFIGFDRSGVPIGTLCDNEIKSRLTNLARNEIKPPATITLELVNHDVQKGTVLAVIEVNKGNGVFAYKGVHYRRIEDNNYKLDSNEIFQLQKDIKRLYFDEQQASCEERPGVISDIDEGKVATFLAYAKPTLSLHTDLKRFLLNNNLMVNGGVEVKNAAIMLFGKDPQRFVPQLKVSLSAFPSTTITSEFSKAEYSGDILKLLNDAYIGIRRNVKVYSFTEGLKRLDVPAYPLEALREGLTNAIVHRDYFDRTTEVFIKIFTDRIEFLNPANFPFENYTFDEIKRSGLSKRRNPIIAKFFEDLHYMEQQGRGLTRIEQLMKEHGLPPPEFEVSPNTFKLTLHSATDLAMLKRSPYARVADFTDLNERQLKFIEYLKGHENRPISRKEYMGIAGISIEKTASRDLEDLFRRRIIQRMGETRGTRYFLLVP